MSGHVSVLSNEVINFLDLKAGKVVVDATLGRAGHAESILKKIVPGGLLIGIDKDPQAVEEAAVKLGSYGKNAVIVQKDFRNIASVLSSLGVSAVDAMMLDLGVSSPQLENGARGFSFQHEGPLDMRMDPGSSLTAEEIVNRYPAEKLRQILWDWGEERMARRIVERLVEARRVKPVRTTKELENIIFHAVPKSYRYGRLHPATRSFQALRIAVNGELEALEEFLREFAVFLKEGGRLVVISFHSLEDRMVKNRFRELEKSGMGRILTKKPVIPTDVEMESNPRSRSAKLRVFLKTGESQA